MRSSDRAAVVTVLHPVALPYAQDFVDDWNAQDDTGFVMVVVHDGVELGQLAAMGARFPIVEIAASGTPAALRARAIHAAAEHAELLVFADADDRFRPDRLGACRRALEGWDALGHDYTPFTAGHPDGAAVLGLSWDTDRPFSVGDLRDGTPLGLGTSASRRAAAVSAASAVATSADVFDWDFYEIMLRQGARIRFVPHALTRYRQHDENLVGALRPSATVRAALVKAAHYERLAAWDETYVGLGVAFRRLADRLETDAEFRDRYSRRKTAARAGWWYDVTLDAEV